MKNSSAFVTPVEEAWTRKAMTKKKDPSTMWPLADDKDRCVREKTEIWLRSLAEYSSLHGLAWYNRTDSVCLKMVVAFLSMAILVALPAVLIQQFVLYSSDRTVQNAVEWKNASTMVYPNITLCDTRYFDNELLAEHNISDTLASYMTVALDATLKQYFGFVNKSVENFDAYLASLDTQLEEVMAKHNYTDMLQLFKGVAVRCDEFISFCEAHRKFYISRGSGLDSTGFPYCCDNFFNPEPIFTHSGTCFTTNVQFLEVFPSIYSSLRIWTFVDDDDGPRFDMTLLGSDATERHGMRWTLTHHDHPARGLFSEPQKAESGTSTLVALRKEVIDRTHLSAPCLSSENEEFVEKFGVKNTNRNCHIIPLHYMIPNCTMATFYGFKQVNGLPPCKPRDILSSANEGYDADSAGSISDCQQDCVRVNYLMRTTSGSFDINALSDFINSKAVFDNGEPKAGGGSAMVLFYFESFDYPTYIMYQEGFLTFLSKVGGWMGLAIGSSVISLIELCLFLSYLGSSLLKSMTISVGSLRNVEVRQR